MSEFEDFDKSQDSGQPIYCFDIDSTSFELPFYYTNAEENFVLNGNTYVSKQIALGPITFSGDLDNPMTCDITLKATDPVAQYCCFTKLPKEVTITCHRVHRPSGDTRVEFIGIQVGSSGGSGLGVIKLGSLMMSLLNGSLNIPIVQRFCNNTLGDARCKVNMVAHTANTNVIKIDRRWITIGATFSAGSLVRGSIKNIRTGEEHPILAHEAGDVVNVGYEFVDVIIGDIVQVKKGCNLLRLGDCKLKYNNVVNYNGFDFTVEGDPFSNINMETTQLILEKVRGTIEKDVVVPPVEKEDDWGLGEYTVSST